jgi:hypothetical protein
VSDKTQGWRADAAWSPRGVEIRLARPLSGDMIQWWEPQQDAIGGGLALRQEARTPNVEVYPRIPAILALPDAETTAIFEALTRHYGVGDRAVEETLRTVLKHEQERVDRVLGSILDGRRG